jgi:uncharacterized protein (TIGR03437 family)
MQQLRGVAVDSSGNLYIADTGDSVIRKVSPNGTITTVAGAVESISTGGAVKGGAGYSGDGGPATGAQLDFPGAVAVDAAGNLYIADTLNNRIRKVATSGTITTIAGTGTLASFGTPAASLGDGGPAVNAELGLPSGVAVDAAGNVYIADSFTSRVRKIATNGTITTVAGSGMCCTYPPGDGGPATSAEIVTPDGVAVDSVGNLYIADYARNVIRKVSPAGIISTVAGTGAGSYFGDGGPATSAGLYEPWGIAVDSSGNLYIADSGDQRIREVLTNGTIISIAGNSDVGYSGDRGQATNAELNAPTDVAVSATGGVYVADSMNNVIRLLTPPAGSQAPAVTLVQNAEGGSATIAPNSWVAIKGSNLAPAGDSRIWQGSDFVNNQMPTQLDGVGVTMNGENAYVYYISPAQVNVLTPPDLAVGPVQVKVTTGGVTSASFNAQAQEYSPSFFILGAGPYVVGTHANGALLGPTSLYPGLTTPAAPGEVVILYANGFGPTMPPIAAGSETQSGSLTILPVIQIGGITATVQFAGLVSPGLYQFNVIVPSSATAGDNPVTALYNGITTQTGVLLTVQ